MFDRLGSERSTLKAVSRLRAHSRAHAHAFKEGLNIEGTISLQTQFQRLLLATIDSFVSALESQVKCEFVLISEKQPLVNEFPALRAGS